MELSKHLLTAAQVRECFVSNESKLVLKVVSESVEAFPLRVDSKVLSLVFKSI